MKQEEGKMELFEEVGQTLSRTGQGLAQKARDTAQVTKLKLAVSEDERLSLIHISEPTRRS